MKLPTEVMKLPTEVMKLPTEVMKLRPEVMKLPTWVMKLRPEVMKLPSEVMKVQAGLMRLKNRGLFVVHRGLIFAGRCMPATIFSALFPMIRIHVSTLETKPALKSMIRTHDTPLKRKKQPNVWGDS